MMANIDWVTLSRLIPETILVIVVLGFVWQTSKRQDNKDERRDAEFLKTLSDHDAGWRTFLENEQIRQEKSSAQFSERIEKIAGLVSATNQLIVQHDSWERMELQHRYHKE